MDVRDGDKSEAGEQYYSEQYYTQPPEGGYQPSAPPAQRPLPPVPETSAIPGQSHTREMGDVNRVADGMRALRIAESPANVESFFLRNLGFFKGDYNGEAITEWTERIDVLKEILNVSDDTILAVLPLRMAARAVEFLKRFLASKNPQERTWEGVKAALLTQFGGKVEPTQQLNQLQQARMGRNTPVREFALQVGRLTRLAYPELLSDNGTPDQKHLQRTMFNRIALEQFTAGLPPLLSRPILENRITEFEKAVDLAAHHEEINARYMRRTTIHAMNYDEQVVSTMDSGMGALSSESYPNPQPQGRGRPNYRGAPSNRKRPVTCFRCHKTGHVKRECNVVLRCEICGERGHRMEDCRNIVCAACKGAGHPANRCPKNSQGRAPNRPNTNC